MHHKIDYFQYYFYRNFFKQVNKLLVDIRGHLPQAKAIVKAGKLFVFQHTNISIKNPTFTHLPTSVFEDDRNDDDGDDPDVEDDDDDDDDDDGDNDDDDDDDNDDDGDNDDDDDNDDNDDNYLDAHLRQVDLHGKFLPAVKVQVIL